MSDKSQQPNFNISRFDLGFAVVTSTNPLDIVGLQAALRTGNLSKLSDRTVCVRYPYEAWLKARDAANFLGRLKACTPKLTADYSYKHDSITLYWGGRQVSRFNGKSLPEWIVPIASYYRDNGLTFVSRASRLVTPFAAISSESSPAIAQIAIRSLGLELEEGEELDVRSVRVVTYETDVWLDTREAIEYQQMLAEMHPSLDVGFNKKKLLVVKWGEEEILTVAPEGEFEWLEPIAAYFSTNGHKA